MKNLYEIKGDNSIIFVKRYDGQIIEALIDTEDLNKVMNLM